MQYLEGTDGLKVGQRVLGELVDFLLLGDEDGLQLGAKDG